MVAGPSANEFAGIVNQIITQEIQSNTTVCINKVDTTNKNIQKSINSDCTQFSSINNEAVYQFNTSCFNNSAMMGSTTNNITNSIMSQLQQDTTGTFPPKSTANLKDGIINIVNTFITQETMTAIINSMTNNNTNEQFCYDSNSTQIAFIDNESFASVMSTAISQNKAVMEASTTISNYISQALSQKSKGGLVALMEEMAVVFFICMIIFVVIAIVCLYVMKKFL